MTAEPATIVVEQKRKRSIRVPLTIAGRGFVYPGLTERQLAASPLDNAEHYVGVCTNQHLQGVADSVCN